MASYRLVMQSGPTKGTSYPLDKAEVFIGRDLGNDVVINDPEVSRKHARVFMQGANYVIEDQGSTNGTTVSGQRLIGPALLRPGDVILLGEHVTLLFEAVQLDPEATYVSVGAVPPQPAPVYQPPSPEPPPQVAVYRQPSPPPPQSQYAAPVSEPVYAGQVPAGPVYEEAERKKKFPIWVIVVIVLLVLLFCACLALVIIDSQNLWCTLFGWLFDILTPGACP